jgi:hypothetical protein
MKRCLASGAALAVALLVSGVHAEDALKSGPAVGSSKIIPFHPMHVTGSGAGTKNCLV